MIKLQIIAIAIAIDYCKLLIYQTKEIKTLRSGFCET